jgi:signal transduction histidine kinase
MAAQRLDRALAALDQAVSGLRSTMHELRPSAPDMTLAERLQSQVEDPRYGALMDVELEIDLPHGGVFLPWQTDHVLAIAGEALSNAARHGRARHVAVRALRDNGRFVLTVEDDGRGFVDTAVNDGFGLRNMRDRARLLGGELAIHSSPSGGTQVKLTVPWEDR